MTKAGPAYRMGKLDQCWSPNRQEFKDAQQHQNNSRTLQAEHGLDLKACRGSARGLQLRPDNFHRALFPQAAALVDLTAGADLSSHVRCPPHVTNLPKISSTVYQ